MLGDFRSCVMRGRRVAEIACGALEVFVTAAIDTEFVEFPVGIMVCTEPVKQRTLANFTSGKGFILTELRLRLESYYVNPVRSHVDANPTHIMGGETQNWILNCIYKPYFLFICFSF